jgi:hypothetical protein
MARSRYCTACPKDLETHNTQVLESVIQNSGSKTNSFYQLDSPSCHKFPEVESNIHALKVSRMIVTHASLASSRAGLLSLSSTVIWGTESCCPEHYKMFHNGLGPYPLEIHQRCDKQKRLQTFPNVS